MKKKIKPKMAKPKTPKKKVAIKVAPAPVKPKPKKRINSRNKGKTGELELVNFLKERGIEARRGQQYEGSSDSPDVVAGGCLKDIHLEVKRVQSGNLYNWMDQACTDADICKMPVVAHRRNNKRWLAILDLRDFMSIVEALHAKETGL
jgi:Holliday junction resolvase